MDGHLNRGFLDPLLLGRYPDDVAALYERRFGPLDFVVPGDAAVPIDFLGVNYYFPLRVHADPARQPPAVRSAPPLEPTTAMGREVAAAGLEELLLRLVRDYGPLPIDITENGAAYADAKPSNGVVDDPERVAYLEQHLAALERARAAGADVRRCYAWSLPDNFEWEHGYDMRFGSCTSTSRPSGGCPSAARSGTATGERGNGARGRLQGAVGRRAGAARRPPCIGALLEVGWAAWGARADHSRRCSQPCC